MHSALQRDGNALRLFDGHPELKLGIGIGHENAKSEFTEILRLEGKKLGRFL